MQRTMKRPTTLRDFWRLAQWTAKTMDSVRPFWWKDDTGIKLFLAPFTPEYRRMWEQLIRQRRGE